jgi:hypothetical protein
MSWMDRWREWRRDPEEDKESPDPELVRLLTRARDLPDRLEPDRDRWSGIENRISGASREASPSPWSLAVLFPRPLAAAAVGLFLVATTAISVSYLSGSLFGESIESVIAESGAVDMAALAAQIRERDGVAGVHRSIRALLEANRANLPPETIAVLDENLRSIDRAIAEIHLALESNPDHHALSFMLAEAYRSEAELLERLEWWLQGTSEATS